MEDSGICVGREEVHLELLCAPAVNPLCFHFTHNAVQWRGKLAGCLAVYTVCLRTVCACTCAHVGVGDAAQAAA